MANIEKDLKMKIKTLRKALEYISNDVELWRATIELEEPEEAKSLLYKAIECVPYNTSIWIALAKLENYQNARKVLNNACKKIPTDHTIWVHAAKLEEAEGNFEMVPKLLRKGIKNLEKNVKITREQWLKEAYDAEMSASIVTAKAIIHETKNIGVDDIEDADECKRIWTETAENFLDKGAIECSRAMIECACKVIPKDHSVWLKAIELEKNHGSIKTLGAILKQALDACCDTELFYLMYAKHLWKQENKIEEAVKTLQDGLHNLDSEEELYLALVKLYREKRMYDESRQLLIKGRQKCDSNRIWMQSAQIEREVGNPEQAKLIIKTAIEKYPTFYKLYLIYATLETDEGNYDKAREIYEDSVKKCKPIPELWICYAKLEQSLENYSKARTILQKGRIKLPKNDLIWIESIYLEIRANNLKVATHLCSKALQACPESGRLWSLAIELEPVKLRKSKALQAIKACEQDPNVAISLAKQFWKEKKYDKTQRWLKRATGLNPDLGDAWAYLYKYELENGDEGSQKEALNDCIKAEPHHGELWLSISKQVENWRLTPEEILKVAINLIQI